MEELEVQYGKSVEKFKTKRRQIKLIAFHKIRAQQIIANTIQIFSQ